MYFLKLMFFCITDDEESNVDLSADLSKDLYLSMYSSFCAYGFIDIYIERLYIYIYKEDDLFTYTFYETVNPLFILL